MKVHPHAVFLLDDDVPIFKIKTIVLEPDDIVDDGTEGGDEVETLEILEVNCRGEFLGRTDVVLVNEENDRAVRMFLFNSEKCFLHQFHISGEGKSFLTNWNCKVTKLTKIYTEKLMND